MEKVVFVLSSEGWVEFWRGQKGEKIFHKKGTVQTSQDAGRPREISFSVICVGTQLILSKVSLVDVLYQWQYFSLFIIQKILGHVAKRFGWHWVLVCGISVDFLILAEILLEMFRKNWKGAKYNHIYEFPLLSAEGIKVKKWVYIKLQMKWTVSLGRHVSSGSSTGVHDPHTRIWWPRIVRFACSEGLGKIKMNKSCSHCFGRWDHELLVYMCSACWQLTIIVLSPLSTFLYLIAHGMWTKSTKRL